MCLIEQEVAKTDKIILSNSLASYCCLSKAKIEVDLKWTIEHFMFFAESEIVESFISTEFASKYSIRLYLQNNSVQIDLYSSNGIGYPHPIQVELTIIGEKHTKYFSANTSLPVCLLRINRQTLKSENFASKNLTISCKIESLNR